jgi:phytoene synthase
MMGPTAHDPVAEAVVRDAARAGELDRYIAALLAPRPVRRDLIALAAFLGETARIGSLVSEPMIGEIRLQWWHDALTAGEATGNPIADAFLQMIERRALPRDLLVLILDARARELDPQLIWTGQDLDTYLDDTEGAAFRLAARLLGVRETPAAAGAMTAAAQAYGRVRLLRSLPLSLAKGRGSLLTMTHTADVPADWAAVAQPQLHAAKTWLVQARQHAAAAPDVVPAILPVALVEPYLAALEKLGPNIAGARAEISPLTRVWRLWRASARGRP